MLFRTPIVCPNIYPGRFRVSDSLFSPRWGFPFTKVDTLDRSPLKFFTTSSFHVKRIPHPVDGVHEEGGYIEDRAWSTCYVVYIICERIILIHILQQRRWRSEYPKRERILQNFKYLFIKSAILKLLDWAWHSYDVPSESYESYLRWDRKSCCYLFTKHFSLN